MRKWPCDVCEGPVCSLGEVVVTCPRAHQHHVCVDCQLSMYDDKYGGAGREIISSLVDTGDVNDAWRRHYYLKMDRCPLDVTDADRALWALAEPAPSFDDSPF